ncbi:hypothetical protein CPLU01_08984 [Colletotrichum plurivorum]|uniref:Uncharacterized protein n=1 Tax=Colletotrichum plurivorum TaxID=2175906 RepID=A0A8H6K9Q9_9PEZI|nr:hypothetical protein CPLU01_08984 [Colletotrichum plurivorum]
MEAWTSSSLVSLGETSARPRHAVLLLLEINGLLATWCLVLCSPRLARLAATTPRRESGIAGRPGRRNDLHEQQRPAQGAGEVLSGMERNELHTQDGEVEGWALSVGSNTEVNWRRPRCGGEGLHVLSDEWEFATVMADPRPTGQVLYGPIPIAVYHWQCNCNCNPLRQH